MPSTGTPERGTLLIAAPLILAIVFAGSWIYQYASLGAAPWSMLPWFGIAAVVIVVVGLLFALRSGPPS